jgi:cold-inducible RNA-binding protein
MFTSVLYIYTTIPVDLAPQLSVPAYQYPHKPALCGIVIPSYNQICENNAAVLIKIAAFLFNPSLHNRKSRNVLEVKLYVGNMTYDTTEDQLRTMFAEAGSVVSVDVIKDRYTGSPKGFAFITMESQPDAAKAISMFNGKDVDGRPLTVNTAKPREERSGGGRSNYGQGNRGRGGTNNRY